MNEQNKADIERVWRKVDMGVNLYFIGSGGGMVAAIVALILLVFGAPETPMRILMAVAAVWVGVAIFGVGIALYGEAKVLRIERREAA